MIKRSEFDEKVPLRFKTEACNIETVRRAANAAGYSDYSEIVEEENGVTFVTLVFPELELPEAMRLMQMLPTNLLSKKATIAKGREPLR